MKLKLKFACFWVRTNMSSSSPGSKRSTASKSILTTGTNKIKINKRNVETEVIQLEFSTKTNIKTIKPEGKTFKGVIGKNYSVLKSLMIRKNINGPSWLKLRGVQAENDNENMNNFVIFRMQDESGLEPQKIQDVPPLSVLSIQTQKHRGRIGGISMQFRDQHRLKISDNVRESKSVGKNFLLYLDEFKDLLEVEELPNNLTTQTEMVTCSTPSQMGNFMATIIETLNPDMILGHELLASHLPGILELMNDDQQKKLSRFRSTDLDRSVREMVKYRIRKMFRGRLLCDTFGLSKENLRVDNYELEALAEKYLNLKSRSNLAEQFMYKAGRLLLFSQLVFELSENFEFLELTNELSKIAGCLWSTSLRSARAERNEMLLMHYFWKEGFVVPEKNTANSYKLVGEETGKKGYKGGLVLEPEVGMYEDYVVLVDFNSLYPSIIRNFNICFTTIQRNLLEYDGGLSIKRGREGREDQTKHQIEEKEEEKVDLEAQKNEEVDYLSRIRNTHIELINGEYKEIQNRETPILVRIVTLLIEKRKQVKGLLKNKNLSTIQRRKFDIIQTAYKLTANSIYGCLGFPSSRFYSRLIADTVTGLGRQLLVQSKKKVEESGYKVIYGDTDSIMINTESENIQKAVHEAIKIKEIINKMFRKKKTTGNEIEFEDQGMSDQYNQLYNANKIEEEKPDEKVEKKPLKRVSQQEGVLQVGIDGVYKKLLLIRKKKYAGLMITNWNEVANRKESFEKTKLEMKGLEVVRRDCSQITREITQRAIEIILYHDNYLELLQAHLLSYKNALASFEKTFNRSKEEIQSLGENEKLRRPLAIQFKVNSDSQPIFSERSQNSKIEVEQPGLGKPSQETTEKPPSLPYKNIRISLNSFVIKKMLNKALKYYSDMESHPHLVVAKYLMDFQDKTDEELIGRFIPYIITQTEKKVTSVGKKAMHISAIKKNNANVDIEWYKNTQIKPILSRSIGVVPNIDDAFICKMLGIKNDVRSDGPKFDGEGDSLACKIKTLPKYFSQILKEFGLEKNETKEMFKAVCPNEQCPGCYVFLPCCPEKNAENQSFSKHEVQLRLEMVLHQIISKYRECLKFSILDNSKEINPLLDKDMGETFKNKYKSIDDYFLRIQICFYVYFLLFKASIILVSLGVKDKSLDSNVNFMNIFDRENQVEAKNFIDLLQGVNKKLKGFKTNYLNELIDMKNIKV